MIDWGRVSDLRDEIGEDDFNEIMDMFLDETDVVVSELSPDASPRAMESSLHFLKGSALNIGLSALAQICSQYERAAAAGATELDIAGVVSCYAQSRALLVTGLDRLRAA